MQQLTVLPNLPTSIQGGREWREREERVESGGEIIPLTSKSQLLWLRGQQALMCLEANLFSVLFIIKSRPELFANKKTEIC